MESIIFTKLIISEREEKSLVRRLSLIKIAPINTVSGKEYKFH